MTKIHKYDINQEIENGKQQEKSVVKKQYLEKSVKLVRLWLYRKERGGKNCKHF